MRQFEQLNRLFESDSADSWRTNLLLIAGEFGFNHVLFGLSNSKTAPMEEALIITNYPGTWRDIYMEQQMHIVDPTVAHCLGSMVPIAWNSTSFKGCKQNEFYEQARGFGLSSGISLPIHGSSGEFGMLSLVSSDCEHLDCKSDYSALATLSLIRDFSVASIEQFTDIHNKKRSTVKLTMRELECIKWVMGGKSSWEIARILSCSEATINFHIGNLKKKFNVHTRQQAVVKAIKEGLIAPT